MIHDLAMTSLSSVSRRAATASSVLLLAFGCAGRRPPSVSDRHGDTGVVEPAVPFHGWSALRLRNGHQRVTIVPAIGRVMGLDFAEGATSQDPLWRHPRLGAELAADDNGWINYGGDKAWPAPQSDWPNIAGRRWPPPVTFDARPFTFSVDGSQVEMLSAVDPAYGLRVRRRIKLFDDLMFITTTYEKVAGAPVRVAVWTITQLEPPERMFALLPRRPSFEGGYRNRMPAPPRDVRVDGRLLSLGRDPVDKTMIGSDADALLWIGQGRDLVIENVSETVSPQPGEPRSWPDGAHAQIYTSPDGPEAYVELELLGPLAELRSGQSTSMEVRYRLLRRREADPLREAQRVFEQELRP
jgi:hypothetical protein